MSSPFPARSVALLAALVAAGVEVWLTIRADLEPMFAFPLAIATGATAIWSCLALDALLRRRARPDRADIAAIHAFQNENHSLIQTTTPALRFLTAQPALAEADHALARAAATVETWESLPATLPIWYAARRDWNELAERLAPGCTAGADMPTPDQLRIARNQLPITRNFSSEDLKSAALYITQVQHLAQSRRLLSTRRDDAFVNVGLCRD